MTNLARRVAENHGFQNFILGVILVTAVIVGLETSETLVERYGGVYFASFVFVAVFVVVNLFIAVVLNNLESAKLELQAGEDRRNPRHAVLEAIEEVPARLEELERRLREQPMAGRR